MKFHFIVDACGYLELRVGRFELTASGRQGTFAPFGWFDLYDWKAERYIFNIFPKRKL